MAGYLVCMETQNYTRESLNQLCKTQPEAAADLILLLLDRIDKLEARVLELENAFNKNSRNSHEPLSSDGYRRNIQTSTSKDNKTSDGRSIRPPGNNLAKVYHRGSYCESSCRYLSWMRFIMRTRSCARCSDSSSLQSSKCENGSHGTSLRGETVPEFSHADDRYISAGGKQGDTIWQHTQKYRSVYDAAPACSLRTNGRVPARSLWV